MGQTITTHLVEGTPKGIQSVQIGNKTIMSFSIPRASLKESRKLHELKTSCLYILFGEDKDDNNKAYIGQTDDFLERIVQHNQKDFWNKALVFTTHTNTLNKADILYLEYKAIQTASKVANYQMDSNKQNPKQPKLQRHTIDTLDDFFRDIEFITEFMGYSIFRNLTTSVSKRFFLKSRGIEAQGIYDENGFTVLQGSGITTDNVPSYKNVEKRRALLQKLTKEVEGKLILKQNKTFNSPSAAADFCIGSNSNGWVVWKNAKGKTLYEVYRK